MLRDSLQKCNKMRYNIRMSTRLYDSIIVGGGPAGLSAAIYMGRFNRSVLVIDARDARPAEPAAAGGGRLRAHSGRWHTHEINENYLGFPNGIRTTTLRAHGVRQAEKFGAEFAADKIATIRKTREGFALRGARSYRARSVILASGVADYFPAFKHEPIYLGRSLFWCITCDGHKTIGKRVVVLGNNDEAACTCMQLKIYHPKLTFVTNDPERKLKLSPKWAQRLKRSRIPIIMGSLAGVKGRRGYFESVTLDSGETIATDYVFSLQPARPQAELAAQLGVQLSRDGYVNTDVEQRTSVRRFYAAGDVTRNFAHQIASAVHEGSMAAQAANYDLYDRDQLED